jgi:hypothetical protein
MAIRITCINKDNGHHDDPHEAISYLGWIEDGTNKTGKMSRLQMVEWIEHGGCAYVKDVLGQVKVVVRTSLKGNKYVKTVADGRDTDNLLKLLECK